MEMAKKLNGKLCEQHLHNVLLNGSIYTGSNKLVVLDLFVCVLCS